MLIAKNLRQLRLAKSITQEELAERIGVTGQAVSKWERDESYPDITLLPGLANFFGVTVDKLIGMEELNDMDKKWEIGKKMSDLSKEGKYREALNYAEEMLKIYPDDYGLMSSIAQLSALDGVINERTIRLCEFAAANIVSDKGRGTTVAALCFLYKMNGEIDKAAKLALSRPHCREAREMLYPKFLDKPEREAYLREHLPHMLVDMALMIKDDGTSNDMRLIWIGEDSSSVSVEDAVETVRGFLNLT